MHSSPPKLKMRIEPIATPGHNRREDSPIILLHNDLYVAAHCSASRIRPILPAQKSHFKPI